jgi:Flp pilus assembly protein TadG
MNLSRPKTRQLRRILKDCSGLAVIEFAAVVPVLIILTLGVVEVSNGIINYMKVIDAARTTSDLISQQKSIASSDFDNLYRAGQMVMTPSPGGPLGLAMASVTFDPQNGSASVAWECTRGGASAMTNLAAEAAGLGAPGESVIVVQATYTFTSPLQVIIPATIPLRSRMYSRPRAATGGVTRTSQCT